MGIITTGSFAKALYPGVNTWYGKAYSEYPVEYTKLFDTNKSRRAWEEDVSVSSFGLAQIKAEGAGVQYDSEQQGFMTRYTHVEYALGFVITRNMVDDDLYDVVGQRKASGLAFSMRQTKETVAANVYNRAFNGSYVGGDGLEMVSTAHVNIAGGTWSNELTTPADVSEASLEQACIDIAKFTNDRGLKIAVKPKALIVPVDLDFEVNKIMKTEYEVGTANNTVNIVRGRFPGGIIVNHYLTDTDAWFIRTDVQNGLKYFERRADDFGMDEDFDTENAKYKATARYSFGWTDPRAIYGSQGA
jgi:hypothetical protein